ncbi:MAG TPA: outer membrane lipoprotein carrier protein LolA [Acidocella sp.]|uniref:LolA family protein n=1 Tax=Acidocella sp. TaxID=50710 RepID=UPI002C9EDDAD|nr:outer membrane lipoprotein carrier protein LolA [Acidocella sp.]HVE23424.1 outer membrane lipoprotein carrier protein LolA [Acidocella sp.]
MSVLWAGAPAAAQPAQPLALTAADQALVAQVEAYLNDQKGLTADFLQVASDGSTRTGKAWLERPGKMRFEYAPPDPQLLVAGFGLLVYHDPDLDQTTNIPLESTPLGILLAKRVDLTSGNVVITNIQQQPGEDDITLVRKGREAAGSLTLSFSTDPLALRQWVVNDAQGRQTRVTLYNVKPGGPYPNALFEYSTGNTPISPGG